MNLNHNKKRNIGLLREFFSKYIADNIVENKKNNIVSAKQIWSKHVNDNSEIKKEFYIVDSLLKNKFSSKEIAYEYMQKLKNYSKNISNEKLEKEKTFFIREINNKILDKNFFNRNVENYTDIASVQLLVNNWISESKDNFNISNLEDKILSFLCTKKDTEKKDLIKIFEDTKEKSVDGLVIKIMNEKFNKKFNDKLSEEQKFILKNFIFENNSSILEKKLESLRDSTIELIDLEIKKKNSDKTKKEKLEEVRKLLVNEYYELENVSDKNIVFYMSISKLNEELKEIK